MSSKKRLFLFGCATGALTATALLTLQKYLSGSNNESNTNKIVIVSSKPTQHNNDKNIEQKQDTNQQKQMTIDPSLAYNTIYKRLQMETKPRNTFYYQYVPNAYIPFVTAINILIEYIPNSAIKTIFLYLPNLPNQFDVSSFVQNGWEVSNDTLHDYPNIYVENVLPIQNQPSLILTVGLPGSGKTTWAKIRTPNAKYVIAADDYFDKFNNGQFQPSLLGKAHEWAQQNIYNALKAGQSAVANNTNTTLSEMHAYVTKVIFANLPHKIVFAIMPETNIKILSKRGLHGVPAKKCKDMLRRMSYWLNRGPPSIHAVFRAGAFKRYSQKGVSKEVIYTGIFMQENVQDRIRKYFMSISGQCLLPDTTDCHLTLKFMPLQSDVDRLPFGKKVCLRIVGYAFHKYVNCFLVDIMDASVRELCTNKYAHITVSFNKSYLRPNYANNLLCDGKIVPVINNFDVINTKGYDTLYRNMDDINGGGLVVEGCVGAYYKNPNGVYVERREQVNEEAGMCWDFQNKGSCKRGSSCKWSHQMNNNNVVNKENKNSNMKSNEWVNVTKKKKKRNRNRRNRNKNNNAVNNNNATNNNAANNNNNAANNNNNNVSNENNVSNNNANDNENNND